MSRQLIVGDLHGCWDEFQELLDTVGLTSDDQIIHIGDLVDRGPYPAEVVDFFIHTPNAISIKGNRDDKHVQAFDGDMDYFDSRLITRLQYADDDHYAEAVDYMRDLPLYIELPEIYLVHGYFEAGVSLEDQRDDVLLGHPSGEKRLNKRHLAPWQDFYDGDKPIAFGHRDYDFLQRDRRLYAIDTRCVYGGALTGLLLPDFTLHSIPAREDHWAILRAQYTEYLTFE